MQLLLNKKLIPLWCVLALALGILLGVSAFFVFRHQSSISLLGQTTLSNPTPSPSPTPEPSLTFLLMGRGGAGHDGGALTDTMLVVRFLLTQKRAVVLSLPRDLWVNIPYDGAQGTMGKINLAYAIGIDHNNYKNKLDLYAGSQGGGTLAKQVVTNVTGLSIDKYVTIDFSGFEKAIDVIGGVDINVERAFTDYEYPIVGRENAACNDDPVAIATRSAVPSGVKTVDDGLKDGSVSSTNLSTLSATFPCRYEILSFAAGQQHMDGNIALKYVRSRHSAQDGNDFARSRRQQLLIDAVAAKLFSANLLTNIPNFFNTLRSNIDTDISATDLLGWIPQAPQMRSYPVTQLTLTDDNYLQQGYSADRQYVLAPRMGQDNYTQIQNWIASYTQPEVKLLYPVVEIDSAKTTALANLQTQLQGQNIPSFVGSVPKATTSGTLTVLNANTDEHVVSVIAQQANATIIPNTKTTSDSTGPDIRIVMQK